MSDMSVKRQQNSQANQVHEHHHVQDTEKAKNTQSTHTDPSQDHTKDWQKFSGSHEKVSAPHITEQSATQKAEQKQNQEKLQAAEIQRHLEQQRLGIKA